MEKEKEDRIIGVIALFITLTLAMLGLYLILIAKSWAVCALGIWILSIFLFFVPKANIFLDKSYRHCPDKRRALSMFIIVSGAITGMIASGMDLEVVISPIRMAVCCWGICWGISGAYLLLHRETYFFGE